MALTLVAADYNDIRSLTGVLTTDDDLPDATIAGDAILGVSTEYVINKVLLSVKVSELMNYATLTAARNADVNTFIANEMTVLQQTQFKRAVKFRCAGEAMGLLAPVTNEGSADILTQRRRYPEWEDRQAELYEMADAEVRNLQEAYPEDAFLTEVEAGQGAAGLSFVATI